MTSTLESVKQDFLLMAVQRGEEEAKEKKDRFKHDL